MITAIIAASIVIGFAYYEYSYESHIIDYISDECWYVSAARNILRVYFGLTPHGPWGGVMATVELENPPSSNTYDEWVNQATRYIESIGGKVVKSNDYYAFKDDGNFLPAVCVVVPPQNTSLLKDVPHSVKYAIGYCYPNARGILDYMNFEHPPLVKYLIGLAMITIGDYPSYWRVPSVIAGCLILVMIFLALRKICGEVVGAALGLVAMILTAFDITFRSLSMVAMLDIFVALFTYMTYYMTVRGTLGGSATALGLGFVSKFSGAFPGLPALVAWLKSKEKPARTLLYLIYVPVIILLILSIPFIVHDGFMQWWDSSIAGAIRWHLSVKTTGGPPQAMPWDWIIGRNPFPLHYTWDAKANRWVADLIARGNPILYTALVVLSVYIIPKIKELPDRGLTYGFTWGTFFMYILIWFLGSKTQYSFYSVQVVPLFYTLLVLEVYYLLNTPKNIVEVAKGWKDWILTAWDWLAGYVEIKISVTIRRVKPRKEEEEKEMKEEGEVQSTERAANEDAQGNKEGGLGSNEESVAES